MDALALIEQELVEMRQARDQAQARLDQILLELQQLNGAISFGEYLIGVLSEQEMKEEEDHDRSS